MGILGFGKADPSSTWGEQRTVPVVLDLRNGSLCGVAIGQDAAELARFGKPTNAKPFKEERFNYDSMGFTIEIEHGKVVYFGLVVEATDIDTVDGCRPEVICPDGISVRITPNVGINDLLSNCLTPRKVDEPNSDDAVYFIPLKSGFMLEAETSSQRHIRRLNLYRE